jgi:glucokinase
MDFGGTNLKAGIFDHHGSAIAFVERKLSDFTQKGDLLQNLISQVKIITEGHVIEAGGLAIKGLINTKTGVLEDDIGAGGLLAGRDLRKVFGEALQIPFVVENDARAYAWGEWRFGAGIDSKVMVCMTLGTGLGCALVVDQKPYQGSDPLGGVLGGHISIDRNGPKCPCGNFGCLELYCSAPAFNQKVKSAHPELSGYEDALPIFFKGIGKNKKEYVETLRSFQNDLAIGVVNVIHAYGPDRVVIGGGVMRSSEYILPYLVENVHEMAWTFPRKKVIITAAKLANKGAAMGVAFHPLLD